MKIEYDSPRDLLNIEFLADVPIDDSLELDGIVIDYAKDRRVVAIDILDASNLIAHDPTDLIDPSIVRVKPGCRKRFVNARHHIAERRSAGEKRQDLERPQQSERMEEP